ncbi:MAG: RNA polymerase sigma factor [Prolixibacteraceae bacterium]
MKKIDWTKVYTRQAPFLKGVCRRYVKDLQVAEDMVHNAFETAMQKIDTFKGFGSFEGWMRRIAINQCLQYLRQKQTVDQQLNDYEKSLLLEMKVEEVKQDYSTSFSKEELLEVIDGLPDQHKLVFNLYVLDGYKHHEIAEMLNISTGTSKSNLSRARKKAQKLLMQKSGSDFSTLNYRRSVWVLLLFSRFNVVDHVFRSGLKTYSVAVRSIPILTTITNPVSLPLLATLTSKLVIGLSAAAVISGAVLVSSQAVSSKKEFIKEKMEQPHELPVLQLSKDTIAVLPIPKKEDLKLQPTPGKVVVRKQIIVRDTVYVSQPELP